MRVKTFSLWAINRKGSYPPQLIEIAGAMPIKSHMGANASTSTSDPGTLGKVQIPKELKAVLSHKPIKIIEISLENYIKSSPPPKQDYIAELVSDALGYSKSSSGSPSAVARGFAAALKPDWTQNDNT